MGLFTELKKMLKIARAQLTHTSTTPQVIHFSYNFQAKAKSWRLSEKDALDVYYHGSVVKQNMLVRKYNGYEIGIYCFLDTRTGQTVITSIWKRNRR